MKNRWQCTNNVQETGKIEMCSINTDSIPNSNSRRNPVVIANSYNNINEFLPAPHEANKDASAELTQQLHSELKMCSHEHGVLMAHSRCKA